MSPDLKYWAARRLTLIRICKGNVGGMSLDDLQVHGDLFRVQAYGEDPEFLRECASMFRDVAGSCVMENGFTFKVRFCFIIIVSELEFGKQVMHHATQLSFFTAHLPDDLYHVLVLVPHEGPLAIETTHQALAMSFEPVICRQFHSSSSTTSSVAEKYTMVPLTLSEWSSFESDARLILKGVKNMLLLKEFIPVKNRPCANETDVRGLGDFALFDPLVNLMKTVCPMSSGTFSPIEGCPQILGDPDRIWATDENGLRLPKLAIEFKTPWEFPRVSNLIEAYQAEIQLLKENKRTVKGKVVRALEQIFVYMAINRHRYGVLTTLDQTWFIRRADDDFPTSPCSTSRLEISPTISSSSMSPNLTLTSAWMAVLLSMELKSNWIYAPPRSSSVVNPSIQTNHPPYQKSYDSVKLDGLIDWGNSIGRSQTGAVTKGQYLYFKNVVFKTMDLSKIVGGLEHFKKEVAFYQQLESLQGTLIPKFIAFGTIYGMLQVLVLEDVGKPISLAEFQRRKQELDGLLDILHSQGVNHNDLRLPNIMMDEENRIRFIDFGQSSNREVGDAEEFLVDDEGDEYY
ncbi:hypothetical protein HDU79_008120 [Rhizoclosmatium sp. JEL0117]|nr:hypothetical protein HDU79_008120 [Rhizoclosmatium sp. JEL0117]